MAGAIRVLQHGLLGCRTHTIQPAKAKRPAGCRPVKVDVVNDLVAGEVPEARIVVEVQDQIEAAAGQAHYGDSQMEVAAARATILRQAIRRIAGEGIAPDAESAPHGRVRIDRIVAALIHRVKGRRVVCVSPAGPLLGWNCGHLARRALEQEHEDDEYHTQSRCRKPDALQFVTHLSSRCSNFLRMSIRAPRSRPRPGGRRLLRCARGDNHGTPGQSSSVIVTGTGFRMMSRTGEVFWT